MVKEETNVHDWKKRIPYEESEAAYHKKHGKDAMPVKEEEKAPAEMKGEPVRRAAGR
jgi:hypothetical protein